MEYFVLVEIGNTQGYFQIQDSSTIVDPNHPQNRATLIFDGNKYKIQGINVDHTVTFIFPLSNLPQELLWVIFGFLDLPTILNLCQVNRYLNTLISTNDFFWTSKIERRFLYARRENESWKNYFLVLSKITQNGSLNVEKAIFHKRYEFLGRVQNRKYIRYAIQLGDLDFLKTRKNYKFTSKDADIAAQYGQLAILKWMSQEGYPPTTRNGANNAATNDHADVLDFIFNHRGQKPDKFIIYGVMRNGCVAVLECLFRHNYLNLTQEAVDSAAGNGHFNILEFLYKQNLLLPSQRGADLAAENGHVQILEFMRILCLPFPSQHGINQAAINGHLDVLIWAKNYKLNIEAGIHRYGIDKMLSYDFVGKDASHILYWNLYQCLPKPELWAIKDAMTKGHAHIGEWATQNFYSI